MTNHDIYDAARTTIVEDASSTISGERRYNDGVEVESHPLCLMCGAPGQVLYEGLRDRPFDTPGMWRLKKCTNYPCGILWLDPMPTEEDVWKAYQTYYTHPDQPKASLKEDAARLLFRQMMASLRKGYIAHKYGYGRKTPSEHLLATLSFLMPWRRSEWDVSVMFLPDIRQGRLLELGSGAGHLLAEMNQLGWSTEGVDVDPAAVKTAREKGLKVNLGQLEDLAYPDNYFDAICMSHVIEHLHNPGRILKECHRILKPGGHLSLITPNAESLCHRWFGSSWFALEPPRHLHIFTVETMRLLLGRSGFDRCDVFTTIRDADSLYVASRCIHRTGRFKMHSRQPRPVKFAGRLMQICEWALLKASPRVGEELSVLARK